MRFSIFEKIEELENLIFRGYKLWIFKGYVAVNKRGVEKIIDDIYATLPVDVLNARHFLKEHNSNAPESEDKNQKIYDVLKDIEILLDNTNFFSNISIVDEKEFEQLETKLKDSIPQAIYDAEKIKK